MITSKIREKIKKDFYDFNSKYNTVAYPSDVDKSRYKTYESDRYVPDSLINQENLDILDKTDTPKLTIQDYALKTTTLKDKEVYYSGVSKLNLESESTVAISETAELCIYKVQEKKTNPYMMFILEKNNNSLTWPVMKNGNTIPNVINTIKNMNICSECIVEYKGEYTNDGKQQLWFEYKDDSDDIKLGKFKDKYLNCLISEIVNVKKALTFDIDKKVTRFFLQNKDFLFLKNDLGEIYEVPQVAYYGNYYKCIASSAVIGILRGENTASHGPYYYFGNYEKAMNFAFWKDNIFRSIKAPSSVGGEIIANKEGLYTRGGILRVALFTNNLTVFLNRETDLDDSSETTIELSKKSNLINALKKTRDVDGKWAKDYDTAIQGQQKANIDSTEHTFHPTIVVKKFDQYYPLEYYYVDTSQKIKNNNYEEAIIE